MASGDNSFRHAYGVPTSSFRHAYGVPPPSKREVMERFRRWDGRKTEG